jgi:predicted RND superfamily exporter protein
MQSNMGSVDRIIRIVIGLVVIALGVIFKSWWGVIGVLPLFVAFVNFCPLYALIGINTRKTKATSV